MARIKEDLEKVTLNLTPGDKDTLADFYPGLGWSVAARLIINKTCRKLRERESQSISEEESIDQCTPDKL